MATDASVRATAPEPGPDPEETHGYHRPVVDVPGLRALLDGRHAGVRDLVRQNLVDHASLLADAEELDREAYRGRVLEVLGAMCATGQTGMGFPVERGGGGDVGASVAAFETLAMGDLSLLVKTGVQFGLFGGAVLQLGTERHHDAHLDDIVAGRLLGCFAMTETGHGSNVQAIGTTATYDALTEELVVHTPDHLARKDYIGGAARDAELAVVFAQLVVAGEPHGVHALLVPLRRDGAVVDGVEIEDCGPKLGLQGVDNGRLRFDHVRVPRTALLNRFADVTPDGVYESPIADPDRRFFTMLGTLVQGRVSVGAAAVTAAKVALAVAVPYADRRRQFRTGDGDDEELLLDHGLHQRRLLPRLARTFALHVAQQDLAATLHDVASGDVDDERARRELESRAAGLKALTTWHATDTIQECREACGGAGYLSVNRFAALKADTDVFTTFEGDNHVLLQLVAKGLLTGYAHEFEGLDPLGTVRYVAGLAVETVLERTSVHSLVERIRDVLPGGDEWDQEAGLLDPDYHLAMLRYREEHSLAGLARRLKRGADDGDPAAAFSRAQDHVVHVARASVERQVLESFVSVCRARDEGDLKVVLGLLCDLFALSTIEADRAWFIEHGRLSTVRSKAISREVGDLCRKLRPLAVDLVDAFGVPAQMRRAPELLDGYGTAAGG
jgi:acyl-CoA oxidase